jgi:hypothetical protein
VVLPLVSWLPAQAPEATQALALVADQVSVAVCPVSTFAGASVRLTLGTAAGARATTTDWLLATPSQVTV